MDRRNRQGCDARLGTTQILETIETFFDRQTKEGLVPMLQFNVAKEIHEA